MIKYIGTSFGKENGCGKTKKKWVKLWKTKEKNQFCSGKRSPVMDSRNSTHVTHSIYVCLFYQILVNRFVYKVTDPKTNDIIVFLPNGNEKSHYYVKRVIGVPGDTVQIKNGAVYVNGKAFDEETDVSSIEDAGLAAEEITLGADEYFVLGDNRNNSEDSRYANIGNIKKDYIIGKAWFRIAPFSDLGFL